MGGLVTLNAGKAIPVHTMKEPREGRRALQLMFDFTGGTVNIIVTLNAIDYGVEAWQTMFIDNSNSAAALTLTMVGTNQRIACPPYSQGYYPVLTMGPTLNFTAASGGAVVNQISLLNFFVDMAVWSIQAPGTPAGTTNVTGTVNTAPYNGVDTDRSGALAVAGTSQSAAAANGARKRFFIQNPSTAAGQGIAGAESLFVNFTTAAGVNNGTSIELTAGQSLDLAMAVTTEQINVNAVTVGHRWIAKELQ